MEVHGRRLCVRALLHPWPTVGGCPVLACTWARSNPDCGPLPESDGQRLPELGVILHLPAPPQNKPLSLPAPTLDSPTTMVPRNAAA